MPRQTELIGSRQRTRVVAGILRNANHQVLITDRSRAESMRDLWEFPGGKVEHDESAHAALHRELAEELGIDELEFEHFRSIEHDYPNLRVSIDFYIVSAWQGTPSGIEGQQLRWVDMNEFDASLLLPADAPIVHALWERLEVP
jgi:8-oxo-dGTP diphosphatase